MKKIMIVILILLMLIGCDLPLNSTKTPHSISISEEITNGSVIVIESANHLEYVTLDITPDEGYEIEAIFINGEKNNSITFLMPDGDVEILVTFKKIEVKDPVTEDKPTEEEKTDSITSVVNHEQHTYENGGCIYCEAEVNDILLDVFGFDTKVYNMLESNPYNVSLRDYGRDVYAVFYEPNLSNDPYTNVSKTNFYNNYVEANSYEDAYYRTKHRLMSGDITPQDEIAEIGYFFENKSVKVSTALYILDYDGDYLGYVVNDFEGASTIVYYGAAYTSLEEIAAYMLAFGEQPINTNYNKDDKSLAIGDWGVYGRVNNGYFSANNSRYKYQPSLPSASYTESDFGTKGGHIVGGTRQSVYNNGNSITRGAARFVYTKTTGIVPIENRHVFYTANHYNDFQEYLNYYNGWTITFGNESAGNPYCYNASDWSDSYNKPTTRPSQLVCTYDEALLKINNK